MKKKHFESMKVDTMTILINRSGKAGGHIAEVRTGCGVHKAKKGKGSYNRKGKKDLDYDRVFKIG
jgi:hypothetical protein